MNRESVATRYGAIDIGTNAIRLVVKEISVSEQNTYWNKLCYTRMPIRLGADVFTLGSVSEAKMNQLVHTFEGFKQLMKALNVQDYRVCSTSAMREASNAKEVIDRVKKETDVLIEVLSGVEEAELIMSNFKTQNLDPNGSYLYIDVGGGSTEVSLIENNRRIESRSFKLGTVRILKKQDTKEEWKEVKKFAKELGKNYTKMVGVGTGGSINKIFKESGRKSYERLTYANVVQVKKYYESFSVKDRINILKMRPDRADVIVPAAKLYKIIMKEAKVSEMIVPKIGLSDGIILDQYLKNQQG